VVWRPSDEPPVEEWRAEGLAEPEPAHAPTVTLPFVDIPVAPEPPQHTEAPPEEPAVDAPLPTRVPGHHLSHQPNVVTDEQSLEADPLRPYRVHELLTRHDLGKRRGRAGHDAEDDLGPVPGPPTPPDPQPDHDQPAEFRRDHHRPEDER
jgi:hypothetical protein